MADDKQIPESVPDDITLAPGKSGGMGFGEFARLVGEKLARDNEQADGKARAEADALARAHEANACYLIVTTECLRHPRGGWRSRVVVRTIETLPFMTGPIQAMGVDYDRAVVQLRLSYAKELERLRLIESWDDCRAHAARVKFIPSMGDIR